MISHNGNYLCALCGAEIKIAPDERPVAMIKASSGEPDMRVVMVGDRVLHACPLDPNATRHASSRDQENARD